LARQRKVWYNIKGVGFKKFYASQKATVEETFNVDCKKGRGKGFKCKPRPIIERVIEEPVEEVVVEEAAPQITLEDLKKQAADRRAQIDAKVAEARGKAQGYTQTALDFLAKYNINIDTEAIKTQLENGAEVLKTDALAKAQEYARAARTREEAKELEIREKLAEREAAARTKLAPYHLDTLTAQEIKDKLEAKKAEYIAKVPEQYAAVVADLDAILKKNADAQFARISKFANKTPEELAAIGYTMVEANTKVQDNKAAVSERVSKFFGGEAGIEAAKAKVNQLVEEANNFST